MSTPASSPARQDAHTKGTANRRMSKSMGKDYPNHRIHTPMSGKTCSQLDYQWELPRRYNHRPDIHGSFSAHPPGKLYLEASAPRPHCRLCHARRQETMPSMSSRVVTAGSRVVHGLAIFTVDAEHLCLPPLSPQATSQSLDQALAATLRPRERRGQGGNNLAAFFFGEIDPFFLLGKRARNTALCSTSSNVLPALQRACNPIRRLHSPGSFLESS